MAKKNKKTTNIIFRITEEEKDVINIKSSLFNKRNSDYIRNAVFSHWENSSNVSSFKELLKMYQNGDDKTKKDVVNILFEYYRRNGFPHNVLTDDQKENRMNRIIMSKDVLLENNNLQMNFNGLDLANSYHPHMMEAHYRYGEKSPMETFNNDESLKDCINRWMELGKTPSPSGMRRILKTRDGTRGVVNFKPSIAKYIYDNYCPNNGFVLDPCSGYSGRLAGCIASNKNIYYHGIDPNGETAIGNMKMASFFSSRKEELFARKVYKFRFKFDLGCAEEVMPTIEERKYDLIFTSPPYYNIESYSNSYDQSSLQYNSYKLWKDKFLFKVVDESYRLLKESGFLILNVKNSYDIKIADDLIEYCKKEWELQKTYYMRLTNREYNRKKDSTFHTEPIFVFKKKRLTARL